MEILIISHYYTDTCYLEVYVKLFKFKSVYYLF